jgi:hypothetical protein
VIRTYGSLRGSCRETGSISSGNFFVPLLIGAEIKKIILFICRYIKNYFLCITLDLYYNYNYNYYNLENILNKNKITDVNNNFNSYLAGLFEGDGYITISRGNNQSKNKISRIRKIVIGITFHIKDLPLCQHLKFKLQEG